MTMRVLALSALLLSTAPAFADNPKQFTPGAIVKVLPLYGDVPLGGALVDRPSGSLLSILSDAKVPASQLPGVRFEMQAYVKIDAAGKWGFVLKLQTEDKSIGWSVCTASLKINDIDVVSLKQPLGNGVQGILSPIGSGGAELQPGMYKAVISLACPDLLPKGGGKTASFMVQAVKPDGIAPFDATGMFLRPVQ